MEVQQQIKMVLEQIQHQIQLLLIQPINVHDQKNNFIDHQVVHKQVDKKIVVVIINDINEDDFDFVFLVLKTKK